MKPYGLKHKSSCTCAFHRAQEGQLDGRARARREAGEEARQVARRQHDGHDCACIACEDDQWCCDRGDCDCDARLHRGHVARLGDVLRAAMVAACLVLVGCKSGDPTPPKPDGSNCTSACDNIRALGCKTTTPDGAECEVWLCRSTAGASLTACAAHASDCDAAFRCR